MNKVILVGNLTRDPQIRQTSNGVSSLTFTVACNRRFKAQDGTQEADFIPCVAWRQNADFIAKHFRKGNRIVIDGEIRTRSWEDKQTGERRYSTQVQVEHAEFAAPKKDSQYSADAPQQAPQTAPSAPDAQPASPPDPAAQASKAAPPPESEAEMFGSDWEPVDDEELPF